MPDIIGLCNVFSTFIIVSVVQEVDPLDAFMAEINEDAAADVAAPRSAKQGLDLDEEEDHVADYMQVGFVKGRITWQHSGQHNRV